MDFQILTPVVDTAIGPPDAVAMIEYEDDLSGAQLPSNTVRFPTGTTQSPGLSCSVIEQLGLRVTAECRRTLTEFDPTGTWTIINLGLHDAANNYVWFTQTDLEALGFDTEFEVVKKKIIEIDIKPGAYLNCLNMNGHGLITVAVLGSDTFDITQIDASTLKFAGLDVRVKGNSQPQCSIEDVSGDFTDPAGAPDGYDDLVCHFIDDPNVWTPDNGTATLDGALLDGTTFEGSDAICIIP